MSDPKDPYGNPPGWTDPYSELTNISGSDPVPPLEDPRTPAATPPGSPMLTGLVVGLLLVALSVAVFQLLKSDDTVEAGATTTTAPADGTETTVPADASTTSVDGRHHDSSFRSISAGRHADRRRQAEAQERSSGRPGQ